jgi:hypothetical protein
MVVFFYLYLLLLRGGATIVFLRWLTNAQNNVFPITQMTLLIQLFDGVGVAVSG